MIYTAPVPDNTIGYLARIIPQSQNEQVRESTFDTLQGATIYVTAALQVDTHKLLQDGESLRMVERDPVTIEHSTETVYYAQLGTAEGVRYTYVIFAQVKKELSKTAVATDRFMHRKPVPEGTTKYTMVVQQETDDLSSAVNAQEFKSPYDASQTFHTGVNNTIAAWVLRGATVKVLKSYNPAILENENIIAHVRLHAVYPADETHPDEQPYITTLTLRADK